MIYNASAQRMKREDERNQADGGAQARQADIAFPAQPLPAADKPAQPAQTAAESSAAPAGLFSPAPAAPDNKQKKAASLIGDLSHPDFMKPIRETAGAAAGKKPATAYVGYDFTKMLQEARGPGFPAPAERFPLWRGGPVGGRLEGADALSGSSGGNGRPQTLPYNPNNPAKPQQFLHLPGAGGNAPAHATVRLTDKQKKAASLVYDLSDPDFMNAIQKSAGLDAKTAAKNGGYSFTHMLQSELNTAGYPFVTKGPLKVDGVFGPKTQAAYAEFVENAPRLLGEGGAQATLSAARTPSADPTMRVSPDTEIIPVEIPEEPVTRFLPAIGPAGPQEESSDEATIAVRQDAEEIIDDIVSDLRNYVKDAPTFGQWSLRKYTALGALEKERRDLEQKFANDATWDMLKSLVGFAGSVAMMYFMGGSYVQNTDIMAAAGQAGIFIQHPEIAAAVINAAMDELAPSMEPNYDEKPNYANIASLSKDQKRYLCLAAQIEYLKASGYAYMVTGGDSSHQQTFIDDLRARINELKRRPIQKYRSPRKNQRYNDALIDTLQRAIIMNITYEDDETLMNEHLKSIEEKFK